MIDERTMYAFLVMACALGALVGFVMGKDVGFRDGYLNGMRSMLKVKKIGELDADYGNNHARNKARSKA